MEGYFKKSQCEKFFYKILCNQFFISDNVVEVGVKKNVIT